MRQNAALKVFVEIPDHNLFLGTSKVVIDEKEFENRVNPAGAITWEIPLFCGIGKVSNVQLKNLEIGRDIRFSEEVSLAPYGEAGLSGCGRLVNGGYADYSLVRKSETGEFDSTSLIIGRKYINECPQYWNAVYRTVLKFQPPVDLTKCEAAALKLTGMERHFNTTTRIHVVKGTWTTFGSDSMFSAFQGWSDTEGAYSDTEILNETFNSSMFDPDENYIRLNEKGRAYIEECAAAGTLCKLVILSETDLAGDTAADPTGDEYMSFEAESARLEIRYNMKELENSTAIIYQAYDPVPSISAEMLRAWTGVVHDWVLDDHTLDLTLMQDKKRQDILVPSKLINTIDFEHVPDANIGLPHPLLIGEMQPTGEHRNGQGNFAGVRPVSWLTQMMSYSYPNCFKVPVIKDETDRKTVMLSGRKVAAHAEPFFIWNSSRGAYELYGGEMTIQLQIDGGMTIQGIQPFTNMSVFPHGATDGKFRVLSTVLPYKHESIGAGAVDGEKAYDKDENSYAALEANLCQHRFYFAAPDGVSDVRMLTYVVWAEFDDGVPEEALHLLIVRDKQAKWDPENSESWETFDNVTPWTEDAQKTYATFTVDSEGARQSIDLEQFCLVLYRLDSTPMTEVRITDICAIVSYTKDELTELYTYGKGLPFGSWIDGEGRDNDCDEDDIVENPSYVSEAVAREEMGYNENNLDVAAFDASASLLPGWKFAFGLNEQKSSMKLFGEIGEQSKSTYSFDERNCLTVQTWNPGRSFPHANANTPDVPAELDIFDEYAEKIDGIYQRHPIEPETFKVRPMKIGEVKNNFHLHYKYNPASREYEGYLFIGHGDGDQDEVETNLNVLNLENGMTLDGVGGLKEMTANCHNRIKATNTMDIRCPFVTDIVTATRIMQFHVETRAVMRWIVEIGNDPGTGILHEIGDYINVRHQRMLTPFSQSEMLSAKWRIIFKRHDQDRHRIELKAAKV